MKKGWLRAVGIVLIMSVCCTWAAAMPRMLIPGGCTMGIKLYSKGVIITGVMENSAAEEAGLRKGDLILSVDGEAIHTAQGLRTRLDDEVILTIQRKGKETKIIAEPDESADGYALGVYVRDSMAGIGTLTYYDPEGQSFGALGHGVNDADTGLLLPLEAGVAVSSSVAEVKRGEDGVPGELKGKFNVHDIMGSVDRNTENGIFGKLSKSIEGVPIPVAMKGEVRTGTAEILSNVQGVRVCSYSVEILKVYSNEDDAGRNLLLRVTDEALLRQTGGIVQGMGVIDNRDNTEKPENTGFFAVTLSNDPTTGV